ncbi:MAG: iron ABC transporter substrate-binding protein [Roseovarius sp. BRH_c41]|jgi:iron-chelate-transporting ATPase|uniref:ABC transporter ATP-binding protein n=1 Tax=Roseovarius sp. BRH_c41 TaxID=1629709 RepID=UPI0005F1481F|nr:ATP-binding cassette domain-containing protein [Roseovarius sp. BRH_c41]KJS43935.1 MAG: iron ABC transporter substrate-binding protein [Roseovarius sp. BRH_c41]
MTDAFEIDHLSYAVPARRLLEDVTLRLPAGRVIGLIGHNGSGKSTLLKLLARQIKATAGHIRLDGKPLTTWPNRAFARRLAYLPQHLPPAEGLLVRELAALGRYPWHGALGRPGAADHAAIEAALAACALGSLADRRVATLSGGEAQRAWLAMLIAQEAGVLLLDEPISALDITHQVEVLRLVQSLSHRQDRTVILVLHDLNMAARFCDHIVALRGGRLAYEGPPDALMARGMLHRVYGTGMEVLTRADGTPVALPD